MNRKWYINATAESKDKGNQSQKKDQSSLEAVDSAILVDDTVPAAASDCGPAPWHADALSQTLALGLVFKALGLLLIATLLSASEVAGLFLTALLLEAHAPDTVGQLLDRIVSASGLEGRCAQRCRRHRHRRALVDLGIGFGDAKAHAALTLLFLLALLLNSSILSLAVAPCGLFIIGAAPSVAVARAGGRVAIVSGCSLRGRTGLDYLNLDARSLHSLDTLSAGPVVDNNWAAREAGA